MTHPSLPEAEIKIPGDVMEAAKAVYAGLHANNYDADCDDRERGEDVDAIAFAILAERRRCAGIADAHANLCNSKLHKKRSDHDLAVFESAASEAASIAASIRGEA